MSGRGGKGKGGGKSQYQIKRRKEVKDHVLIKPSYIKRLARKSGIQRVSADIKHSLTQDYETHMKTLVGKAIDVVKHAHKKTIQEEDIRHVSKLAGLGTFYTKNTPVGTGNISMLSPEVRARVEAAKGKKL